jgi:SEC-C motif-containing protein
MNITVCPCGSGESYQHCCALIHQDHTKATSPEQIMRARYTAFTMGLVDFLYDTYHPETRIEQDKSEIKQWAEENEWLKLDITRSTSNAVEFKAYYIAADQKEDIHYERSIFRQWEGNWYYLDGNLLH